MATDRHMTQPGPSQYAPAWESTRGAFLYCEATAPRHAHTEVRLSDRLAVLARLLTGGHTDWLTAVELYAMDNGMPRLVAHCADIQGVTGDAGEIRQVAHAMLLDYLTWCGQSEDGMTVEQRTRWAHTLLEPCFAATPGKDDRQRAAQVLAMSRSPDDGRGCPPGLTRSFGTTAEGCQCGSENACSHMGNSIPLHRDSFTKQLNTNK